MAENLDQTIRDGAAQPRRAKADGVEVEQHPLPDQIAADRYLQSKKAARTKGLGVPFKKLSPPGAA
ncbi:MAG: hypothetical protein IT442_11060 [Phycisphaeraceae bacterium]|nr:hypothetical protein [Phycisphaeraceae bacterium]